MLFIMNPMSGLKKANRYLADIMTLYSSKDYEVLLYMTRAKGDATEIARKNADRVDRVVCVGGDGTLNEVITGLMTAEIKKPVGYIPSGSTNDFAATLNLPKNIMRAAEVAVSDKTKMIDVGKFGDRYFSYVASFGAFTKVSYSTPQSTKNLLGHLAYVLEGIKDIPNIKPIHAEIEIDGNTVEDDYIFGAVSNSTSVGGVFKLSSEDVSLNDGLFEMMLVKSPKNPAELNRIIFSLTNGKYANCDMITFSSARKVTVKTAEPLAWTLDGEYGNEHTEISLQNIFGGLELSCSEGETNE